MQIVEKTTATGKQYLIACANGGVCIHIDEDNDWATPRMMINFLVKGEKDFTPTDTVYIRPESMEPYVALVDDTYELTITLVNHRARGVQIGWG